MSLAVAMLVALVVHDDVNLRAAPERSAPRQAQLYQGDWLEVRGRAGDWLQVYDHRHERPGYVMAYLVREYDLSAAAAVDLRALVRFHRDMPGAESLGIGLAALYLRAAPADRIGAEIFDAMGVLAERLARRASGVGPDARDPNIVSQLEVARSYGVRFDSFMNRDERTITCYDGSAFARVLAMPGASAAQRSRAALALSDARCDRRDQSPAVAVATLESRAELLAKLDPTLADAAVGNAIRMRRAELDARLAFYYQRRGQSELATRASADAKAQYQRVDKAQLDRAGRRRLARVGVSVGAAKWARLPGHVLPSWIRVTTSETGQTCVSVRKPRRPKQVQIERCTHGLVWTRSIRVARGGKTVVVNVQPLPEWSELWVLREVDGAWTADALIPAIAEPTRGFVEWAGFGRRGDSMVLAREAVVDGRVDRRFEAVRLEDMEVTLSASTLTHFPTFKRQRAPEWTLGDRS